MQIVIDFSRSGLVAAFRRFFAHAVLAAAVAAAADVAANLQNVTLTHGTIEASVGLALVTSAVHNLLIWLQTKQSPAVEYVGPADGPSIA